MATGKNTKISFDGKTWHDVSNFLEFNREEQPKENKVTKIEPVTFSFDVDEDALMRLWIKVNYAMMTSWHSVN